MVSFLLPVMLQEGGMVKKKSHGTVASNELGFSISFPNKVENEWRVLPSNPLQLKGLFAKIGDKFCNSTLKRVLFFPLYSLHCRVVKRSTQWETYWWKQWGMLLSILFASYSTCKIHTPNIPGPTILLIRRNGQMHYLSTRRLREAQRWGTVWTFKTLLAPVVT